MTRLGSTYANRGKSFEQFLNFANEQYRKDGVALIQKIPTEFIPLRDSDGSVSGAKVTKKSSVDYIGRVRSIPIALEAKHTSSDRIRFDEVKDHQAEFLSEWEHGGKSYVAVSFKMSRFFLIPWDLWRESRDAWKAKQEGKTKGRKVLGPIALTFGYVLNNMASAAPEDFPPEFEVKAGGRYGLDYLKIVQR